MRELLLKGYRLREVVWLVYSCSFSKDKLRTCLILIPEGIQLRRLRFVAFVDLSGCIKTINEKTLGSMKEFGNHTL